MDSDFAYFFEHLKNSKPGDSQVNLTQWRLICRSFIHSINSIDSLILVEKNIGFLAHHGTIIIIQIQISNSNSNSN